jgi:hypothetical protein
LSLQRLEVHAAAPRAPPLWSSRVRRDLGGHCDRLFHAILLVFLFLCLARLLSSTCRLPLGRPALDG